MRLKLLITIAIVALGAWGLRADIEPEAVGIAVLPPPHSKRVYMIDPIFMHIIKTKYIIIDGEKGQIEGMLDGGLTGNLFVSEDQTKLYIFNTFYSKLVRGERSDYLSVYDAKTLNPIEDILIPPKRMLSIPKMNSFGISANKEILYYMNLTPATGVGFINLKEQKYIGETSVPNCNQIFPHGDSDFTMLCSNGSLLTLNVSDMNNIQRSMSKPFFDVVNDPVFEHSAFDKKRGIVYFLSYDGLVYKTKLGSTPEVGKPWSIVTDSEKKAGWRPGGWQVADVHYDWNRMYVIMHKGQKWTHKTPGEEIWVFDLNTNRKIQTIKTKIHAYSIRVSQDRNPYLFSTTPEHGSLSTFDARTGRLIRIMEKVGETPHALIVGGGN